MVKIKFPKIISANKKLVYARSAKIIVETGFEWWSPNPRRSSAFIVSVVNNDNAQWKTFLAKQISRQTLFLLLMAFLFAHHQHNETTASAACHPK